MKAIVLYGINNLFTLETEAGDRVSAGIKGKVLKESKGSYNALAPGDRVDFEPDARDPARGRILCLLERANAYRRWNEKGRSWQTLAANVDRVILVTSPSYPPFRPRFIDRVQASCSRAGLKLTVLLNKVDLGIEPEVSERLQDFMRIGVPLMRSSTLTGEGIEELRALVSSGLSVFTGQSGAGKSSVLNALQAGLGLKVGELCSKWDRGSHTTVVSALFHLEGTAGSVVDTPGFRRFALRDIELDELASYFPEMAGLDSQCAFGPSCPHDGETECALLRAVDSGAIHPDRFESYLRMRDELAESKEYEKKSSVLAHPRQRKAKNERTRWQEDE
jgi:ribosome biogenesis GTPase